MPDEGGFTLLEVVITVALLSIAFVGILTAVSGLVASGVQNRNATAVQAAIRNVAAFTQSYDTTPYIPCDGTPISAYQGDLTAAYPTATVTKVEFWDGNALPADFVGPSCPGGGDQGLERVTILVSSGTGDLGGTFSQSLTVVKRNKP
jgi:prepilin-type N-terminal cleavage/methylation domain-containing protein